MLRDNFINAVGKWLTLPFLPYPSRKIREGLELPGGQGRGKPVLPNFSCRRFTPKGTSQCTSSRGTPRPKVWNLDIEQRVNENDDVPAYYFCSLHVFDEGSLSLRTLPTCRPRTRRLRTNDPFSVRTARLCLAQ